MARMIPERPAAAASTAEVLIFEKVRDEMSGEWTALHSVGMTIHSAKPWAEIDFVLVGPPGVFCLEVKGGIVSREGGTWYTTPRHGPNAGKRQPLKESPFEQVGSASAELFHFLDARSARIADSITGYAVATPDVAWTVKGPDIDRDLVYDQADTVHSFELFMQRVVKRWKNKVGSSWNRELRPLGRADRQLVVDAIRGDFRLVPSLRATADLAQQELVRLTEEQASLFARLSTNQRVLATGGAGTGKTVIAVEEARRLAAKGERVLYTCFNRGLAAHVSKLLARDSGVTVRTLHGLMMDLVQRAGLASSLPNVSEEDRLSLFLPELALEVVLNAADAPEFDTLIIDEGQDLLRDNYLDVVEGLVGGNLKAGRWRIFLDPNQNIFGGIAASALQRVRDAAPVEWPLTVNCRNTAPIATQVALMSGTPLAEVLTANGPAVEIHWYETAEEERVAVEAALQKLKHAGLASDRTVVLSRHRLLSSAAAQLKPAVADISGEGETVVPQRTRFSTISAFKGLEADFVLLMDVDDLYSNEGLASVYVGTSRAKVALGVFLEESQRSRFQDLAKEFGRVLADREM